METFKSAETETLNAKEIEERLDAIYSKIDDALEESVPLFVPMGDNSKSTVWFSERCRKMRNNVAKMKKKYQRKSSERNWINYTEKLKEYKAFCKYRKKDSMKEFLETLPDIKSISQLHKNLVKKGRHKITSLIDSTGNRTLPGEQTLNELIKTHFKKHRKLTPTKYPVKTASKEEMDEIDWIDCDLIKRAMAGFQEKKSHGPDGLCLLYTSPSPRDLSTSRMPSSA